MSTGVIGFCRFSFFGPSDTKLSYDDRAKAFETLYDPVRMETRFLLFEHLLMQAMAHQTNPNFTLHVMSSDVMPDAYKRRLTSLCNDVNAVQLHLCKSEKLGAEIAPMLKDAGERHSKLAQFRIDDDDALSINFIDRLHHWASMLWQEALITMPRGLMLYDEENTPKCQPFFRSLTGAGFAYLTVGKPRRNVFQFSHLASGRRYPAMADPTLTSHIQTFTSSCDTSFRARRKIAQFSAQMSEKKSEKELGVMTREALDLDFPYTTMSDLLDLQATANAPEQLAPIAAQ
ncbi:hypothetical protein ACMU_07295 [Actibacterium mucosum KCTC 23349]|uniref:Rhamnosyl transferase n=1 Tax=Actibacterium mucosum KCTC 23349 TaxID=1454373 RepID=A0A037ZPH5_9RHOB|nr:glycosyltransferase [Actibacterium mucosum]KAJ56736.1 hypothetical protein ACMU_07295 [Actibacterium mucosum KCTC 23349]